MTDPNAPEPYQAPQQSYPPAQTGAPQPVAYAPSDYPGKTLGIVGLVFAFIFALVGLILSIVAWNQSKAAGYQNTPAKVGLILSIIFLAIYVVVWIVVAIAWGAAVVTLNNLPAN